MSQFAFAIGLSQNQGSPFDLNYEEKTLAMLRGLGVKAKPCNINAQIIQAWWYEDGRITDPLYVAKKVAFITKYFPREHICRLDLAVQGLLGSDHPLYQLAGKELHIAPMGESINETHMWLNIHEVKEDFPSVVRDFQRFAESVTLLATIRTVAESGSELLIMKKNFAASQSKWEKVLKLLDEMSRSLATQSSYKLDEQYQELIPV